MALLTSTYFLFRVRNLVVGIFIFISLKRILVLVGGSWRLPPKATEQRDGYLTSTMQRVEEMYEANNGLPIVLVCHR